MMDKLINILETFLNKHFIPTLISIAVVLIFRLLISENFWMIEKLGSTGFEVLVFILCFLSIELVIWMHGYQYKRQEYRKYRESKKNEELEERKEVLKEYRRLADQMGSKCRDIIIEFIETNNKPIDYVRWMSARDNFYINEDSFFCKTRNANNQEIIKLTEEIYEVYSYIYKEYNRIGNF